MTPKNELEKLQHAAECATEFVVAVGLENARTGRWGDLIEDRFYRRLVAALNPIEPEDDDEEEDGEPVYVGPEDHHLGYAQILAPGNRTLCELPVQPGWHPLTPPFPHKVCRGCAAALQNRVELRIKKT